MTARLRRPWVPGLGDVLFLAILGSLLATRQRLLSDGDTAWHIRLGSLILDTRSFPRTDPFSIVTPALPFRNHEWLSQVVMALVQRVAGLGGVAALHAILLAAAIHQCFLLLRSRCRNLFVAGAFTVLLLCGTLSHALARPHLWSFVLLAVWLRILAAYASRGAPRILAWLPVTAVVWANLHGGAIVGPMVLGLEWVASAGQSRERFRALGIALGASIVAMCLNPLGPRFLLTPLNLHSMRLLMSTVTEFQPATINNAPVFVGTVLLSWLLLGCSVVPLGRTELLRLVVLGFMAMSSVRHTALFMIAICPVLALRADELLAAAGPGRVVAYLRTRSDHFRAWDGGRTSWLWPVAASLVACVGATAGGWRVDFDRRQAPLNAIEHMKQHPVAGNGFHSDEFGDFLIYAAYPQYRVFIDGRLDMYGEPWSRNYLDILELKQPALRDTFARHDIRWVLYDTGSLFIRWLRSTPGWRVEYEDALATLLVRTEAVGRPSR
jgi:hypothetical protein